jgi:CheY-like chemotaxis protein
MRVMVADDAVLFREGLAGVLAEAGFEVTAKVADGQALLRRVREDPPDVCVVDIRMPPTHTTEGLDTAGALRGSHPQVGVLVLSAHVEPDFALALIQDGAHGAGAPRRAPGPKQPGGSRGPARAAPPATAPTHRSPRSPAAPRRRDRRGSAV